MMALRIYNARHLHFINIHIEYCTYDPYYNKLYDIMPLKRGGVSVISHRQAKANNQYLPNHDETKETAFIYQVDCNNVYGWSMCENLPIDGLKWVNNFKERQINEYRSSDNYGYVLEVDLEYPQSLHDEHNDYPLAPEHLTINGHKKLAPNLNDKEKYIVHIDNLQYYLSMGMKLKKIYRVVKFRQIA